MHTGDLSGKIIIFTNQVSFPSPPWMEYPQVKNYIQMFKKKKEKGKFLIEFINMDA